ncbi:MAG: hypothetical protein HFJ47_03445 [Clostridia bacterium]|nr:hypothetical protein [Clostridia bacterium]
MENIIIITICTVAIITIKIILSININEIKKIGMDKSLNKIAEKYPSNEEICKRILRKLNNKKVKVEKNEESNNTMYIAMIDKIVIGNTKGSYTRIQTMAHECLHTIQSRRTLMFNVIYSNIYMIFYLAIIIMIISKITQNYMVIINIFLIMSLIYYMIRIYLEDEAMYKAKELAKEYMEEVAISDKEEIKTITDGFEKLNKVGIKAVHYSTFTAILLKVIIFSIVALIF